MGDLFRWLAGFGLEKYAPLLSAHEIDMAALGLLTESDVRDLGLPIGSRRKLLTALSTLGGAVRAPEPDNAERRQVTVMFVDLVGSTVLARRLDPEAMREILRDYQSIVAGEINRFGGYVAKLMGDGVLAYFGWPRAHENSVERAASAGLAVVEALCKVGQENSRRLACRVGIATGMVVVGDLVGDASSQEHLVVGATPNLAARLQDVAAEGQVVVSDTTRQLLGDGFVVQPLGGRSLKGYDLPVPVFRLLGRQSNDGWLPERPARPIVGRRTELGCLRQFWREVTTGEGRIVVLSGESGIGKTRLVRALCDSIEAHSSRPIVLQCSSLHRENPFWPVVQQLAISAGIRPDDASEVRYAKLIAMLQDRVADPESVACALRVLLDPTPSSEHSGSARPVEVVEVLVRQLLGLVAAGPVVVALEDAQWADPATLEFLGSLAAGMARLPVMLIVTMRGESDLGLAKHEYFRRLAVPRLSSDEAASLLVEIAGSHTLNARLIREILLCSDGIPLFVEEVTKAVIETSISTEKEIPATLRDTLIARLDVSSSMKSTAQVAACIGREFDVDLLRKAADVAPAVIRHGLARLIDSALVESAMQPGRYRFRHQLVCDVAYETLLTPRRKALHGRIAELLESMGGEGVQAEPELLARHWFGAGFSDRADEYWQRASHKARYWHNKLDALSDYLEVDASGSMSGVADSALRTVQ